jgi:hypothetical protein
MFCTCRDDARENKKIYLYFDIEISKPKLLRLEAPSAGKPQEETFRLMAESEAIGG